MKLIPVIDLKNGLVVHGKAGNRDEYRPIQSRLTNSCQPRDVALALLRVTGGRTLYLADLDAIQGGKPSWSIYAELIHDGIDLWLDAGVRQSSDADRLLEAGIAKVIVGSETLAHFDELDRMISKWGKDRIVFSLDIKSGKSLAPEVWGDPLQVAETAISRGVSQMIVLDLAQVGMNAGTGTEAICREVLMRHPEMELFVGGGVRSEEDLRRLEHAGIHGVLVATALHQGWIPAESRTK